MKTYYQSNLNLNKDLRGIDYTQPATLYIGLSTTPIYRDGSGITEPSTSMGYERVAVATNSSNWSVATNGTLYNNIDLQFKESTNEWGTITYVFMSDAQTGGNVRYFEALPKARLVQENSTLMFRAGSLKFIDE